MKKPSLLRIGTPYTLPKQSRGKRLNKDSVRCTHKGLKRDFERVTFETDENSNRIGELGIGLLIYLTALIGNILQDEKFPGVHIALALDDRRRLGQRRSQRRRHAQPDDNGWSTYANDKRPFHNVTLVLSQAYLDINLAWASVCQYSNPFS